jgi:carboxymethylenebutenolidase
MTAIDRAGFLGVAAAAAATTGIADAQTDDFGKPHAPIVAENDPAIVVVRPQLQPPGGAIGAYVAMPKTVTATTPGVVMVCHIWGADAQYRDMARRLAKAGYIAIIPGIFDRVHIPNGDGQTDSSVFQPYATQMYAAGFEYGDILAAHAWVKAQAPNGKIGIYGNCMGGGIALQALVGNTNFAAASVLYGYVRADRKTTEPPPPDAFAWAPKVTAAVIGSYGAEDKSIAWDDVQAAFGQLGGPHDVKLYEGAAHAFLDDTRPSYRPGPAADAWARQMAWFAKYLQLA